MKSMTARAFNIALLKKEITVDKINYLAPSVQAQLVRKNKEFFVSVTNPTFDFYQTLFTKIKYRRWNAANIPADIQMKLVVVKPDWIRFIANRTEEVMEYCVKADPQLVRYIKEPSESMVRFAYSKGVNYSSINGVLPEDIQLDVMQKAVETAETKGSSYWSKYTIRYLRKPCSSVQLMSVKAFPESIEFISKPTDEVQLFIAEHYPRLISNIKNPKKKLIDKVFETGEYDDEFAKRMFRATARKDVKTYIKIKNQI